MNSRRVRNTRSYDQKSIDRNCQIRANLFHITLSYVTAVQLPAYEWSSTLHAVHQTGSLNDHMLIGPKFQKDLAIVLSGANIVTCLPPISPKCIGKS